MRVTCILLGIVAAFVAAPAVAGTILGTVVNTSSGAPVPCQVTVVLQVLAGNQFVPFRDTVSDKQGRFGFRSLPAGVGVVYQVGATRHGIFHPGPRILLTDQQRTASASLSVCDASCSPNPLVLKKMDVVIRPETGLLRITESLLLDNPSHTCYVGQARQQGADPITLALSVPSDFERTTFDLEYFGRRFALVNGQLATSVPWPPGQRELRYTYVVRNTQEVSQWKRPIDLACSRVTVRVEEKAADEVRCPRLRRTSTDDKAVVFESDGELPAGDVLTVQLGRLPLPWMTYGKWAAVALMLALMVAASWWHARRGRRKAAVEGVQKTASVPGERKKAA